MMSSILDKMLENASDADLVAEVVVEAARQLKNQILDTLQVKMYSKW